MPRPSLFSLGTPALVTYGLTNAATFTLSLSLLHLVPPPSSLSASLYLAGSRPLSHLASSLAPSLYTSYLQSLAKAVKSPLRAGERGRVDEAAPSLVERVRDGDDTVFAEYTQHYHHLLTQHTSLHPCGLHVQGKWCEIGEIALDTAALSIPFGQLCFFAYVLNMAVEPARIWIVYAIMAKRIRNMSKKGDKE
mmetsp:Transcript_2934/g.9612  ORF Transcript_2934/g.9612 Transcript_2934/m.9612 type:complete len:193 (-) Transcript_2934:531-1109(-)